MITIAIQVAEKRDRAGLVEIADGFRTLVEDAAVATSGVSDANRAGGAHPPFGRYELTARASTPGGAETEYGNEILLFEPIAGPASEAESRGRFGVLLYAGPAGRDALLRRTQGGVRLSRGAMNMLLTNMRDDTEVELSIDALAPAPWWMFWRKRRAPPALSKDPPRLTAPPYDEATLAAQLLQSAIRRDRTARRTEADDDDRWRDRDSTATASRESRGEFRGGGGTGGGGGASGSWSDAPAGGRGPGVNAAGVIVGAAGAAAVAAAAAAELESKAGGSNERADSMSGDSGSTDMDSASSSGAGTAY